MQTISEMLTGASFVDVLVGLDRELCSEVKARGCPHCGDRLHVANYARKPRSGPLSMSAAQARRLSLCCRREGCRARALPPSARFLGRRVYLSVMVVLGSVLRQGPTPFRVKQLSETLGADRRTLERWRKWWTESIGGSRAFEIGRADFMPPPLGSELPISLLDSFVGGARERMLSALRFLLEHFGARFPMDGASEVLHAELAV